MIDKNEFTALVERIESALLALPVEWPFVMMQSNQHGATVKGTRCNKLSFRMTFLGLYGCKDSVKRFVETRLLPLISRQLERVVQFCVGKEKRNDSYLEYDDSVYSKPTKPGSCGKKMRALHSVKDDEPNRPLLLVPYLGGVTGRVEAMPIDTLIQFIPEAASCVDDMMDPELMDVDPAKCATPIQLTGPKITM